MSYNASQQKSPVWHDLETTPWLVDLGNFTFHFSTPKHAEKFREQAYQKIEWLNDSMSRRFHVPCAFDHLALVQLYMQIEGRGFMVEYRGYVYRRPKDMLVATYIVESAFGAAEVKDNGVRS